MSASPNAIVIQSSSPEPIWAHSVSPCTPERLFGLSPRASSPPSMLSPSKLFGTPSSIRRLNTSQSSTKSPLKQRVGRENLAVVNCQQGLIEAEIKAVTKTGQTRKQKKIDSIESASFGLEKQTATKQAVKPKKVRVQKSKKSEGTGSKVLEGKIVKSSTTKTRDAKRKTSACTGEDKPGEPVGKTEDVPKDDLNLEEALKRRIDWTPPKNTHSHIVDLEDYDDATGIETKTSFGYILSDYRFSEHSSTPEDRPPVQEDGHPTKRRKIELVEFPAPQEPKRFKRSAQVSKQASVDSNVENSTAEHQFEKSNPPKKKTRTITALVTAQYGTSDSHPESAIKKFLQLNDNQASGKAKPKGQRKPPAKQGKKTAAKTNEPEYIVLSPEAVTKSLQEQDLLFGTCSQLERDDYPVFLRETQKALLESESIASTAEGSIESGQTSTTAFSKTTTSRFTSSKGLWSVAARDLDGSMIQPEVLDMINSPTVSPVRRHVPEMETNELVDLCEKTAQVQPILEEQPNTEDPIIAKGKQDTTLPRPEEDPSLATEPAQAPEIPRRKRAPIQTPDVQSTNSVPDMPRFSGYTDAELSKQIAIYGFKAVKGRKKMISLLEKCWQTKHPSAAQTDNIPANDSQASRSEVLQCTSAELSDKVTLAQAESSKSVQEGDKRKPTAQNRKPRGRPKKSQPTASASAPAGAAKGKKSQSVADPPETSRNLPIRAAPTTANIIVEEIEDSEEEVIPSPARVQQQRDIHRFNTSSHLTLTKKTGLSFRGCSTSRPSLSAAQNTTRDIEDSDKNLPNLLSQITKAVRAQPRIALISKPPLRPTWHEKILLYDPIVVEDLATWLNSEGLDLVGEDREVNAAFVREWCESKGICCLYRAKPARVAKKSRH